MRIVLSLIALTLLSFLAIPKLFPAETIASPDLPIAHNELILLELFTSQGCSSCPPADALLAKLQAEAEAGDLPIVALSYHVDYWNRLGWTDPYSQSEFSKRQRTYASKFPDPSVYTPQIVVHGQSGHVGSREREVRSAIQSARNSHSGVHIQLKKKSDEQGQLSLAYQLDGNLENIILNIATVETTIGNKVPKGENRGRSLQHVQVVRDFQQIVQPGANGIIELDSSILTQPKEGQVVVFVQDAKTWTVQGVAVIGDLLEG